MKNKGLIATIVVMSAVIITLIAVILLMQMPTIFSLDNIKDTFLKRATGEVTEVPTSIDIETEEIVETTETEEVVKLTTTKKTYTSHKERINIEYPEISGMENVALQEAINVKIKNNAISVINLYPISTALQKLNIACDVKYINDDCITILYEGRVVGINSNASNANSKGGSTTSGSSNANAGKKSNVADPYLDGFVDPLAGAAFQQNFNFNIPTAQDIVPPANVQTQNANNYNRNETRAYIDPDTHTADAGPSVSEIRTPTAKGGGGIVSSGYIANNNPSSADGSNIPVYGYTGTDTSARTIDQKIFYTNTIDLKTGKDISLKDFVTDFEALAKYARSSDVEIINIDEADRTEVRNYIRRTVLPTLTSYLEKYSDFRNEILTAWPKHFSYRDEDGTIYFTIKLSSRLGNYAIIKYNK